MKMDKYTQFVYFDIWSPRYHDKRVLLKCSKIGTHNKVTFSKAPSIGTDPFYIEGKVAKRYPKEYNGGTWCYAIPLEKLEPLEISENSILDLK